eukprot:8721029-Pyramimonas_sp.AAC.1
MGGGGELTRERLQAVCPRSGHCGGLCQRRTDKLGTLGLPLALRTSLRPPGCTTSEASQCLVRWLRRSPAPIQAFASRLLELTLR